MGGGVGESRGESEGSQEGVPKPPGYPARPQQEGCRPSSARYCRRPQAERRMGHPGGESCHRPMRFL